ncbi:MAG: hypothetical protein CVV20_02105 [Gemmatimonadetes bacterium HGW-Gemmatimonadetes-1]|nr:MAG: hypothetical protein CVV20_02105 [Gemmatimonadetes bacterium HGW-Gemmatimonadetes-1]
MREFLLNKLATELPPERLDGLVSAYRLLGLIPDTLDVREMFVDLYTEQVAGFYDPESSTLFAVAGSDPTQLRLILAHELVHALQHQYIPLDSILADRSNSDRTAAAQAVLEGQATLASFQSMFPDTDFAGDDGIWEAIREQLTLPREEMAVFNSAPLVIRSTLIFPYLQGSEFMRWFARNRAGERPFGALMPHSTEQILHPLRYQQGDAPVAVRFAGDDDDVIHEDTFGEFEMHVLRSVLVGIDVVAGDLPLGWGGDRLRVYRTADGPALVWLTAWDEPRNADGFESRVIGRLSTMERAGYRTAIESMPVAGKPGVRVVIAPTGWTRWEALPE